MYQDFEYKGYNIKYHSSQGMLCVISYEVFDPEGKNLGRLYSVDAVKAFIDKDFAGIVQR